jgi:hypothetical protein
VNVCTYGVRVYSVVAKPTLILPSPLECVISPTIETHQKSTLVWSGWMLAGRYVSCVLKRLV